MSDIVSNSVYRKQGFKPKAAQFRKSNCLVPTAHHCLRQDSTYPTMPLNLFSPSGCSAHPTAFICMYPCQIRGSRNHSSIGMGNEEKRLTQKIASSCRKKINAVACKYSCLLDSQCRSGL